MTDKEKLEKIKRQTEIDIRKIEKLEEIFNSFGNHETRSYELEMGNLCKSISVSLGVLKDDMFDFIGKYIDYYLNLKEKEKAYNGFYFMSIYSRRNSNNMIFEELIGDHNIVFRKFSTYSHIINIYYLTIGVPQDKFNQLIKDSYKNYMNFPDHSGILNCFSDVIATIAEKAFILRDEKLTKRIEKEYLKIAIEAINKALSLSKDQDQGEEYSKFYYTHGRLLILSKEYEEGRDLINRALYTENKSNKSKLELYRNQLIKSDLIEFFHSSDLVEKEMKEKIKEIYKEIDEKLEKNTIKNIEVLTFFSGLMGFIISSVSIAVNTANLKDAFNLIIIAFASYLTVFSAFDMIIKSRTKNKWFSYLFNLFGIIIGISVVIYLYRNGLPNV